MPNVLKVFATYPLWANLNICGILIVNSLQVHGNDVERVFAEKLKAENANVSCYSATHLTVATQQTFFTSYPIRIFSSLFIKYRMTCFQYFVVASLSCWTLQGGMTVNQIRVS